MNLKRWKAIQTGLASLFLIGHSIVLGQQGQHVDSTLTPIDVIIAIDNSGSMAKTDPQNLRFDAACLLIDYLHNYADPARVNGCIGIVSFDIDVLSLMHLQPFDQLQHDDSLRHVEPRKNSPTDFRPVLNWAFKEFRPHSRRSHTRKSVILFTDGEPQLSVYRALSQQDKQHYFRGEQGVAGDKSSLNMKTLVDTLQAADITICVVAIGDAKQDAELWRERIGAGNYNSIDEMSDLANVYHNLFNRLIGVDDTKVKNILNGDSLTIDLPPYLEQVLFTFLKAHPRDRITVKDSQGNSVQPYRHANHEWYCITDPLAGPWLIKAENGNVQMWEDRLLPDIVIEGLNDTLDVHAPMDFSGSLCRKSGTIEDSLINLEAEISGPANEISRQIAMPIFPQKGIRKFFFNLNKPGPYVARVKANFKGKVLSARNLPKKFFLKCKAPIAHTLHEVGKSPLGLLTLFMLAFCVMIAYFVKLNSDACQNGPKQSKAIARKVTFLNVAKMFGLDHVPVVNGYLNKDKQVLLDAIDSLSEDIAKKDPTDTRAIGDKDISKILAFTVREDHKQDVNLIRSLADHKHFTDLAMKGLANHVLSSEESKPPRPADKLAEMEEDASMLKLIKNSKK